MLKYRKADLPSVDSVLTLAAGLLLCHSLGYLRLGKFGWLFVGLVTRQAFRKAYRIPTHPNPITTRNDVI